MILRLHIEGALATLAVVQSRQPELGQGLLPIAIIISWRCIIDWLTVYGITNYLPSAVTTIVRPKCAHTLP